MGEASKLDKSIEASLSSEDVLHVADYLWGKGDSHLACYVLQYLPLKSCSEFLSLVRDYSKRVDLQDNEVGWAITKAWQLVKDEEE